MKGIHKLSMLRLTKFCQIQSSLKNKTKKNQIKGNKRTGISLSYPQVQNKSKYKPNMKFNSECDKCL